MTPDPSQQKVIGIHGGYHLVLAPPGCGKTQILAERLRQAHKQGVAFGDMLCLTFTNRAARGMRERIAGHIGEQHIDEVFVGNIHRFCSRFLFTEQLIPASTTVIDEDDAISILSRYAGTDEELIKKNRTLRSQAATAVKLAAFMHQIEKKHPKGLRLHPECIDSNDVSFMREICRIQRMDFTAQAMSDIYHHTDFYEEAAKSEAYPIGMHEGISSLLRKMTMARQYAKYKKDNHLIDFEDLLILTYDAVSTAPKGTFPTYHWIQIDEVQDLNPLQLRLVDYFTADDAPTVVYLGDEQQAIFSFMGARMSTLEKLKERCTGHIHHLDENHRSPRYLLKVLNTYATQMLHISPELLPITSDTTEAKPHDLEILTGQTIDDEYQLCVKKAAALTRDNPQETTALIVNSNIDAEILSNRLVEAHVSHFKISGDDLFSTPEVKLLLAHLSLLTDEGSFMAWAHLMKGLRVFETNNAARNFVKSTFQHAMLPSDFLRNDGLTYVQDFARHCANGDVVVFDTETTGLDVLEDDILQIAAVKMRQGEKVEGSEFTVYMRSDRPIPEKLGDIDNPIIKELEQVPTVGRAEGLKAFLDYAAGCVLLGHNATYDYQILESNLKRYLPGSSLRDLHPLYFDTLKLSRLLLPGLKGYKLKTLLEELHLEGENAHLADADVDATVNVAAYCLKKALDIVPRQQEYMQRNNVVNRGRDLKRKYAASWEAARNRLFVPHADALNEELQRFYDFVHGQRIIAEIPKLKYIERYIGLNLVKPLKEKTLQAQLSAHIMEISTLKEADLCSRSVVDDRIYVTTIHKAKGLEFDNVIVFDAVEGRMPNYYNQDIPALLAEDARKFYVALSRARHRLIVAASALIYDHYNQPHPRELTRFMNPILKYFSAV